MKYSLTISFILFSIGSLFGQETDELVIKGASAYFKISSGATVTLNNSITALNTSNSGTLVVESGGAMTADGAVNLASSSSIQVDGNLYVKGNWSNNASAGTALAGATLGTVTFNGTANQNIGGSTTSVFENFAVDNTTGVTLTNNQTISSSLAFTNGIITTGVNRLDMTGTAADNVSGSGTGKYVLGNLRRYIITSVEYTLPIGTATNYEMGRLLVNSHSGLTYVDIAFTPSNQNPVVGLITVNGATVDNFLNYGYWTLTPDAVVAVNYDFSGQSIGHTDLLPSEFNYGLLTDLAGGGIVWQDLGVHSNATQSYSASTVLAKRSQLTAFGSYIIGHTSSLTYTTPTVTEELLVKGSTAVFKISSGATVILTDVTTALNTSSGGVIAVDAGGAMATDGAITLATTSSIQVDGTLSVKGNWTNGGTASTSLAGATFGTIIFNGTASQSIGGSVNTIFENLTINNTSGITLTQNESVNAMLDFTAGIITTGVNRLELTGTTADYVSGSGPGKYVLGNLRRYITTAVEYTLPIGTASNYELGRLFVNSHSGLTYVDATFTITNQNPVVGLVTVSGATVDNFLNYGYWTLTPDAVVAVNYDFSGQSIGHTDLLPTEFNYGLLTDLAGGGIVWQDLGVHSNATQSYSASTVLAKRSQLTSFGNYIIGHTNTLTYITPTITEELVLKGASSFFKVSSTGTVNLTHSGTTLNIRDNGTLVVGAAGAVAAEGPINLSTSGSLQIETNGTMTAEGAVNIASTSSIQVDGNLFIKGNWTNDATASTALAGATIGTITFNGTINQNIGGSTTTIFENFTIDNVAGVTLTNHQTVSAAVTFTNGIITTGTNRLELTNAVDNVNGSGAGKYVLGNIRRSIFNGIEYTLPNGSATNYEMAKLFVNSNTGLTYVDVNFVSSNQNPPPGGLMVKGVNITNFLDHGYWTIASNVGAGAVNYDFSVQSIGHTDLGPDEFNYSLISDQGSGWQDLGVHSIATQSYTASTVFAKRGQLTAFGSYIIGRALPIYTTPAITEELRVAGLTSIFKVSSGAMVNLTNSITALNASSSAIVSVESGGTITAEGPVNIASSSAIQIDGNLFAKGDWINDGTASTALAGATVGTITFNGTSNQNIGGSVSSVFENVTIDNTAGITLTNNQTVNTALAFTNGIITTGSNRLELTTTSVDNVSGSGSGKYVFGTLRRYVTNSVEYTLPIGTPANYEMGRLFVNSNTGLSYIDIAFTIDNSQAVPGGLTVKGVAITNFLNYGYWTLTPNAGTSSVNYDFSAQSTGHTDLGPDEFNYSLITDVAGGGIVWQDLGIHSIATQTYSASTVLAKRNQLTAFGNYIIGRATPIYTTPTLTEELRVVGTTSIFKVSSGATVNLTNSVTALNTSNSGILYVESGGSMTADGAVFLASASSIQVDGSLFVKGNWTNDATPSVALAGATIGTITFNGTANQNIGGSSSTVFENFTIDNTTGATLTNNQTINTTLTFTNGIITTGTNRLDMTGTAADNVNGSGVGKYVFGNFRRYVATAIEYTLPIGTATNYEMGRFFVNSQTGLTYVDIAFTIDNSQTVPGGLTVKTVPINDFLNYGYWTLTPNGGATANYDFSGQSIGHANQGPDEFYYALITDLAGGAIVWQDLGVHSIATQTYSASTVLAKRTQLTSFGSYIIGHTLTPIYIAPAVTEELRVAGTSSIFKISSGAAVNLTNSVTSLNTSNSAILYVESGGSMTADGAVSLASASSIQVDGNFFVKGNWTNDATASTALTGATLGTVTFNGTINQNIGGSVSTTFENFTINNAGGATLTNNQSISSTLTFTSGILTTGAFTLSCTSNSAATLLAGSNSSFVYGTLSKAITTNASTYTFSIGNSAVSTGYHPMQFINNNLAGVSALTVSVGAITEVAPNNDATLNATKAVEDGILVTNILESAEWVINPTGVVSGGSYGINLFVTNVSTMSASDDNAFVIVKRPTASTTYDDWDALSASTVIPISGLPGRMYNAGNGYAQKTGFTAFSRYAIGRLASALPIELLTFSAKYLNRAVLLKWTTATEINNDFFTIERSKDALEWSIIGKVNGAGNSTQLLNYSSLDEKPLLGTSYYRLKQTDFDGNFTYSNVVFINILDGVNTVFDFSVYPNPSSGDNIILNVQDDSQDEGGVTITISDLNGKFVHPKIFLQKSPDGFSTNTISLGKIAQGMYIITGSSSKTSKTIKLIIE